MNEKGEESGREITRTGEKSVLSEDNPDWEEETKWDTIRRLTDFAFFVHWRAVGR